MTESRAADAFEALASFLEANGKGHWLIRGTPTPEAPHPLWAHLVPSSLRAFAARCGYPSLLAPKLRMTLVPLHVQPAIGLAEPGFDWHLYKALLQTAVRRANGAFFAGFDFSDVGGWSLRNDGQGERVWGVEDSLAIPGDDQGPFEDWLIARFQEVHLLASKAPTAGGTAKKKRPSDPSHELRMYDEYVPLYPATVMQDAKWPNGTTKSQGAFLDNKPEGPFRFFYATGAPLASGHFENGVRQGTWRYHLPPSHTEDSAEKRLWGEGEVKDGLEEGPWIGSDSGSPRERTRVFRSGVIEAQELRG
ncbi:hypothetical protein D7V88_01230 [Corallococcus terminator]|uniref:Uncharacterized protein n=2 Tax=Corallococcus terminator TaxID=2316733 RepID=A0A3A8JTM5_9BACT|nr:hypothetical protein D7V88_01230 [Corallococcus terminator]